MQLPSYPSKITVVYNGSNPNNNTCLQRLFDFEILTKHQNLIGIAILIPMCRFSHTIIDVDYCYYAFIYYIIPLQHWCNKSHP